MSAAPPAPSPDWAYVLDIDGTLLEIAPTPDAVRVDDALRALLERVQRACGGAIALVSGRSVREVDGLFAPLVLPVAGQHGIERRDAHGRLHRPAGGGTTLAAAGARLAAFAARHPGIVLEDKGYTFALHYRGAPSLEAEARAVVAAALADLGADYALQEGKCVLELKPATHDKGSAVAAYLDEAPFAGRRPLFVGDDLTDELGFRTVLARGGHAVKVGDGPSVAAWRLADPRAVRAWLKGLA